MELARLQNGRFAVNLRDLEALLDRTLDRRPPTSGRVWREHRRGFHGRCGNARGAFGCQHRGRLFVGRYYTYDARARDRCRWSIHASRPLCAACAVALQQAENHLPHWRPT